MSEIMRGRHDLETAEMCSKKLTIVSKMTPKLRAEVTGERITLLGRQIIGLSSLSTCFEMPTERNSQG
jgi:hypothetical protein